MTTSIPSIPKQIPAAAYPTNENTNLKPGPIAQKRHLSAITGPIAQQQSRSQSASNDMRQPSKQDAAISLQAIQEIETTAKTGKWREITKQTVIEHFTGLKNLGFGEDEIFIIASATRRCGAPAIRAVIKYYGQLVGRGFDHAAIFAIASTQGCGGPAIETVIEHYGQLVDKRFDHAAIFAIASTQGCGATAIKAVIDHYDQLISLDFKHGQILKIITTKNCGAQAVKAVIAHYDQLISLHVKHAKILKIASTQNCGAPAIKAVIAHYDQLIELDFKHAQILKIAYTQNCGGAAIKAVIAHYDQLIELGFNHAQILKLASRRHHGAPAINAVIEHYPDVKKLSPDQRSNFIDAVLAGSAKAATRVEKALNANTDKIGNITVNDDRSAIQHADYIFENYELSNEQMAIITAHCDTSQIEDVMNNIIDLSPHFDFDEQIINIIADGGALALQEAADATAFLEKHGLSTDQITALFTDGGVSALQDQAEQITLITQGIAEIELTPKEIAEIAEYESDLRPPKSVIATANICNSDESSVESTAENTGENTGENSIEAFVLDLNLGKHILD